MLDVDTTVSFLLADREGEPPVVVPGAGIDEADRWLLYRTALLAQSGYPLDTAQDWADLEAALAAGDAKLRAGAITRADIERQIVHLDKERQARRWLRSHYWN